MRLLLAAAVLVTFAVPLANAHIIVCAFNENTQQCEATPIGRSNLPPHGAIFEPPCFCTHPTAGPVAMERFLP